MATVAELALRALAPVPDPYAEEKHPDEINRYIRSYFPPGTMLVTESHEGLAGISGRNRFTIDEHGFRGDRLVDPKPPGEYRVFLMGGSTMECFYLDDADSIGAVLQRELQRRVGDARTVKVYNTGKSGEKTDDHISMYAHRLAHLEPDLVIAVVGFNDYRAAWWNYDYLHYRLGGPFATPPPLDLGLLLRMTATELQIPRRLYYAISRTRPKDALATLETIPLDTNYREKVALRRSLPLTDAPPRTNPGAYRRNLEALVGMIRMQGVPLVLGTQGASWDAPPGSVLHDWHWMQTGPGSVVHRNDVLLAGLAEVNDITRDVARRADVPLLDVAATLEPTVEHYYDDVHWNAGGARRVALDLAELVASSGLLPRP